MPSGAVRSFKVSRWKVGFLTYTTDDPYPANGWVIVLRDRNGVSGSVTVQLWLPKNQHALATRILNSFAVS